MNLENEPYIAIGNGELDNNEDAGEEATCPNCGKKHKIEYGTRVDTGEISKMLGYVSCGKNTYLVAVDNKLLK